ncbi:tRNA 2-thiouridine(34) synthase MnmA [endosymbiont of Ridgeia piscesae]|jgi:tRNA-specific 2-thiouridylase|uniref:tRNA-specific 2-thiouridylase MnmA n=1 Tax=endosymbiont of Ridgeia piscesae TaxID=54398 RepID=A0A0T5Z387_9GAMM|nr:tRNA 2-thiouridine(34) synthase MnmA [endosymbiont of Ridgeia piscesae]KRT56116.1 tRNA (5-methylaminomethyl-2-thiouridylate)-methyltransferase [endosymbiont of Ridgeia piscesae]KRT57312.1 tRNA (5-methylaminomethyl-2-thiouridylate)-methyltransferase [endosymbiont of Ridgeia piscesae]
MNHPREKIIVGMSGGVDSSVAALLLLEQGYQVEGLFMKNWEEDDTKEYCSAATDLADASSVADQLGIPLHSVNFSADYWERVFAYFLDEYRAGRTPNPDVLCNREIKFKAFLDYALNTLGASRIATGHYARLTESNGEYQLQRAVDENKDQTYFLYMLGQPQLSRSCFPLGSLAKTQVRELAEKAGFSNHKKKDSTGICFIGERKFRDFLSRYLPANPGAIQTPEGETIGQHSGLMYYTLGQRQGLGIGGIKGTAEAPWFVVAKDLQRNLLIVAQGHQHPLLMSRSLVAGQPHWIGARTPQLPLSCKARIRHRQPLQSCWIEAQGKDGCRVRFDTPQRAVTPGQSIVFYSGPNCLGGAIIESSER